MAHDPKWKWVRLIFICPLFNLANHNQTKFIWDNRKIKITQPSTHPTMLTSKLKKQYESMPDKTKNKCLESTRELISMTGN